VEQIEDDEGPITSPEIMASGSSKGFAAMAKESAARPDSAASAAPKAVKGRKSTKPVKRSKPKGGKKSKEEASGCCVYYCWSWTVSHRVFAIYTHYNVFLPRTARILLLVMSFFLCLLITGILMGGNNLIATKDQRNEQFACGLVAAILAKILVILLTNVMRHPRPNSRYLESSTRYRPATQAQRDRLRYRAGLVGASITISKSKHYLF
jgi:hypothetical protein